MTQPTPPTSALDAALQIAKAVEANAVALMDASAAVREVVEAYRDQVGRDPFEGATFQ